MEIRYGIRMMVWYTCLNSLLVISFKRIAIVMAITVPNTIKHRL